MLADDLYSAAAWRIRPAAAGRVRPAARLRPAAARWVRAAARVRPPQPGGYGPPPAYGAPGYGAPRSGFDFASVNPLDWGILGGGVLAFIFSFFDFYTAAATDARPVAARRARRAAIDAGDSSQSVRTRRPAAWHGFFGWFGVLILARRRRLAALAVFRRQVEAPYRRGWSRSARSRSARFFIFIALFVDPDSETSSADDQQIRPRLGRRLRRHRRPRPRLLVLAGPRHRARDGRAGASCASSRPAACCPGWAARGATVRRPATDRRPATGRRRATARRRARRRVTGRRPATRSPAAAAAGAARRAAGRPAADR